MNLAHHYIEHEAMDLDEHILDLARQVVHHAGSGGAAASSGSGSGGVNDAQYVVLSTNATLTDERVLTGTADQVIITDNGAGSTVVLSLPQSIHTAATPTFAGITISSLTAGSVIFAGTGGILSQDNAVFFWDSTNDFLGLGTPSPGARLHMAGNLSASAWGINGISLRSAAATYTDTSTADGATVATAHIHSILRPTLSATNASVGITYTTSATWYINNAPLAGTGVTITNPLALLAAAGNVVFNGSLGVGASVTNPTEVFQINGNLSTTAWTTNGVRFRAVGRTYTDTSSSGTVTTQVVDAFQRPTLAASNTVTYTTAATVYITNAPVAGSNVTITNPLALLIDDGDVRMDGKLIVNSGSNAPTAALQTGTTGISANAWGVNGIQLRIASIIATDTSSSGTVSSAVGSSLGLPTFAASSATTYNDAYSVYISGPPTAGSNVTITRSWSLAVNTGASVLRGGVYIGAATANALTGFLQIDTGNVNTLGAFSNLGAIFRATARTLTDTTSSGTVAIGTIMNLPTYTLAASNLTTISDAATHYIVGAPIAGTNVTITRSWGFWLDSGNARFDGAVTIGAGTSVLSGSDLDVLQTTGAIVTIGRNDTSVTAADSLGKIRFYSNDTSTTTNPYAAQIEVVANSTIATDINPGIMIFSTTGTGVADALTEAMRIDPGQNIGVGATSFGTSSAKVFAQATGTAPGSSPADMFQMYSADITAGNAAPHFRTEGGAVIKLYQVNTYTPSNVSDDRSYNANSTSIDELADVLGTLIADLQLTGILG